MSAGRTLNTLSHHWCTPPKYINAIKEMFDGIISLDPCSNEFSLVQAKTEFLLPHHNGLIESWNYPTIYVNPPYGIDKINKTSIKDWFRKSYKAYRDFNSEVLALVPVATNTSHWKNYVFGKATSICFLYDTRLKFLINGSIENKGAPMSCSMIYWGKNFDRFESIFRKHGAVIDIRNIIDTEMGFYKEDSLYNNL